MRVLKCNSCGGDVEFKEDGAAGVCLYCGNTVIFPKVSDEKRLALYNRGNDLRRQGEFDEALMVYGQILAENDNDAEAHWNCALCRFGIEYVEDENTMEWYPTCHRLSYESFNDDVDVRAAIEHSDMIGKRQYTREAKKIADIQMGILATSRNEEPFDVFICYKRSDENNCRTVDSTLAQDIYEHLTDAGLKVFFAEITLEDKVGQEYEPIIFAALNSAKVMITVGTSGEHLDSVWVKNEWSRFLSMMRNDREKQLLPCYKDMRPENMPKALSSLQAYDMSKIGFMQDLVRGVKKILNKDTGAGNTSATLANDIANNIANNLANNLVSNLVNNLGGNAGGLVIDGTEGIGNIVRMTLNDIANNKMANAESNLEKCELKNHKYVGTVIANISYYLSMISSARTQDEARGYMDKVRIYAKRFQSEYPSMSQDEINLYRTFGEETSDIYANLLVVFDTLNDSERFDHISGLLNPSEIFSESENKKLLKIAIKRRNYDMAGAIASNAGHVDRRYSLQEILTNYPENENKRNIVRKLFDVQAAESLGKAFFEQYFESSKDSIDTKSEVISKLSETELRCSMETVIEAVCDEMDDYNHAKAVFSAIYKRKTTDQDTAELLTFCLSANKKSFVLKAFLDTLRERSVFLQLNSKAVISVMDSVVFEAEDKTEIVKKMLNFEIDAKSKDMICNYYLNNNSDDKAKRLEMIDVLLKGGCPVSDVTVMTYIVKTNVDEENKLGIIKNIFGNATRKLYLPNLLSEYMMSSCDDKQIKEEIAQFLLDSGYKADSNFLTQYIAKKTDSPEEKISLINSLIKNGTVVKPDCLENYLLSVTRGNIFSLEIFEILSHSSFTLSANAYFVFLMECRGAEKLKYNSLMLGAVTSDLNFSLVGFIHSGNNITGNVLQAYLLDTSDKYEVSKVIATSMTERRVKVSSEVTVNGMSKKFKKYVTENKSSVSRDSWQIFEENKLFSLF